MISLYDTFRIPICSANVLVVITSLTVRGGSSSGGRVIFSAIVQKQFALDYNGVHELGEV